MKAKNLSIFCLVSILLTGCAPKAYSPPAPPVKISKPSSEEQSAFQKAIIESLNDPDSAKFNDQMILVDDKAACVGVNAKNTFGGYTGFQQAMFMKLDGIGWQLMKVANVSQEVCAKALHMTVINKNH